MYAGIEKAQCEAHFFYHRYNRENPNGGCVQIYVPNLVLKFHDDPTINKFVIIVLLR